MKTRRALDDVLRGRGTLSILRAMCAAPGATYTAPGLARSEGLALSHVQSALAQLEHVGLVDRHAIGARAQGWTLEAKNDLVGPLTALFAAERGLASALREELRAGLRVAPVRRAVLFGSVARGQDRPASDIDLLVEVPDRAAEERVWEDLLPLTLNLRSRFGLSLAPIVVRSRQRRSRLGAGLSATIRREGELLVGSA